MTKYKFKTSITIVEGNVFSSSKLIVFTFSLLFDFKDWGAFALIDGLSSLIFGKFPCSSLFCRSRSKSLWVSLPSLDSSYLIGSFSISFDWVSIFVFLLKLKSSISHRFLSFCSLRGLVCFCFEDSFVTTVGTFTEPLHSISVLWSLLLLTK